MRKSSFEATVSCFAIVLAAVTASVANAQEAAPQETKATSGLSEIVVTAEKRPNTEQKTSIAMTVLTADALAKNGANNLADLAQLAPSVAIAMSGAATIVTVRGVSSRDTSEIGDPAVSINLDGFTLQRALGLNQSMFDLERVEVLRGPQGTLLGRNATGGAISLVTAKPVPHVFKAYAGAEAGSYGTFNTKGMINVPVNDWLTARASFQTQDHSGYRNNAPSENGDDEHARSGRLHLLAKPTDRLSILVTGEYSENHGVGPVVQAMALNYYTAANVPAGFSVGDPSLGTPNRTPQAYAIAPGSYLKTASWNYRAQVDYDLGFANIAYLGGYRRLHVSRRTLLGGAYGTDRQNFTFGQTENLPSWNHELRLSSKPGGALKWQLGGFYFQEKNNLNTQFQDYPGQQSISGSPFLLQNYIYPDILSKSKAVFGQASYEFLPGLSAEYGMRYSTDEKHRYGYNTVTNLSNYLTTKCWQTNSCVFVTTQQNASNPAATTRISGSQVTYHGALNYQITPHNLAYVKFDTGYKAGGFTDLAPYAPEKNQAWEVGFKNRFLDNRLQLNVDAFLYNYSNQQVSQVVINPATGAIATQIVNAGHSRYKGVEADLVFQPEPDTRLNAYVGWLHARYTDFQVGVSGFLLEAAKVANAAVPVGTGYNWQLAGHAPPQAPDWTFNMGLEHDIHLWNGTLTPRIQTHIETKSYFTAYNLGATMQPTYTKSDFTLNFAPEGKAWNVQFYVRNLENSTILSNAGDPNTGTYASVTAQYQAPRTVGGAFTVNW
jgi:iron complex outermembrane receptor protein